MFSPLQSRVLLTLVACLCACRVRAEPDQEPDPTPTPVVEKTPKIEIIPDKLTAEDPEPLDPGQRELEFFLFHSQSRKTTDGHRRSTDLLNSSFSYGIVENLDFSVISGASSLLDIFDQRNSNLPLGLIQGPARGGGLTNLEVEFRYKFLADPDDDWAVATVVGTTSRNNFSRMGGSIAGTGNFQTVDASLVARKNFGRFTTDVEAYVGIPLPTHNQSRFVQTGVNLAAGYQITDWLQPSVELNYLHISPITNDFETLSGTAGLIIRPVEWITFYLGYQRTLTARNTDLFDTYFIGTNFTF